MWTVDNRVERVVVNFGDWTYARKPVDDFDKIPTNTPQLFHRFFRALRGKPGKLHPLLLLLDI
jgi:hypothetical protein